MRGPRWRNGDLVTAGGRVLTVVGRGATFADAIARAYAGVEQIHFDGMQYRRDIGRARVAESPSEVLRHYLRLPRESSRFARLRGGAACARSDLGRAGPGRRRHRQHLLGDRERRSGRRARPFDGSPARIRRAKVVVTGCYATRRPEEFRDAPNVLRVVPNDDKSASGHAAGDRLRSDDGAAFRRRRRQLRCRHRARRRGPDGVHAARPDRVRAAVFVLHHSGDPGRAAKSADRRDPRRRSIAWSARGSRKSPSPASTWDRTAAILTPASSLVELLRALRRTVSGVPGPFGPVSHQLARADGLLARRSSTWLPPAIRSRLISTCRCSTPATGCWRRCAGRTPSRSTRRSSMPSEHGCRTPPSAPTSSSAFPASATRISKSCATTWRSRRSRTSTCFPIRIGLARWRRR